ncbi:MAG TPA: rod shape-determining protein MreD [Burkholderiales bacterium]|jgi:rod shape-determining protein MreD|nr:rod shape-determining protein MreD [Burkholderiales bacterium]
MQLSDGTASRILLPVRASTILVSFALALLANFLPWKNVMLAPDFVALVLAFWCIRQPRLVGLGAAWVLGLLTDAGNGVLMGQHALAYALLAFASITLSRRILWFPLWGQALHVAALLVFTQGVAMLVRLAAGADFPGWQILVGPLLGAFLWPIVTTVLLSPQRRPADVDENRAI